MSLSLHDRRILADIAQHFMEDDPDLAVRLGAFGADHPMRFRIAVAWRHRRSFVLACTALTASVILLVAACAAQNVVLMATAGCLALVAVVPKLMDCRIAGQRRRARSDGRRGAGG
ncbi:DUF3040 domain-containing protein [Streptomyces lydicus]|uniref:DUF3040 domain-containing protein n=1 Tax=Streptomyces lydicus TaxID=47763 RepID=UPI00372219A8